jgi:hypothetical protein
MFPWVFSSLGQTFFDLHAEMTAAFFDVGEDLVAGLEVGDRDGFALRGRKKRKKTKKMAMTRTSSVCPFFVSFGYR